MFEQNESEPRKHYDYRRLGGHPTVPSQMRSGHDFIPGKIRNPEGLGENPKTRRKKSEVLRIITCFDGYGFTANIKLDQVMLKIILLAIFCLGFSFLFRFLPLSHSFSAFLLWMFL